MQLEAERLVNEVADDGLAPSERVLLGLPSPAEARALLARLDEALWAAPLAA